MEARSHSDRGIGRICACKALMAYQHRRTEFPNPWTRPDVFRRCALLADSHYELCWVAPREAEAASDA
eukprot:439550-Amphidinium_carterae.1